MQGYLKVIQEITVIAAEDVRIARAIQEITGIAAEDAMIAKRNKIR